MSWEGLLGGGGVLFFLCVCCFFLQKQKKIIMGGGEIGLCGGGDFRCCFLLLCVAMHTVRSWQRGDGPNLHKERPEFNKNRGKKQKKMPPPHTQTPPPLPHISTMRGSGWGGGTEGQPPPPCFTSTVRAQCGGRFWPRSRGGPAVHGGGGPRREGRGCVGRGGGEEKWGRN